MAIVTTNIGLAAIADATAGGFLVDLEQFAVTSAVGVVPKITDEVLAEEPLYKADVQSIEAVGSNKIKVTLFIPPSIPKDGGSVKLTEVGLYLKSGELFAHGTFKTPFDKNNDFGLRVIVFVVAGRIGEVVNITFGTNSSLASAASVRTLVDPETSDTNAIVVQDAQTNIGNVSSLTAGSLAVRYGAGGLSWAFLGYDLNYRGHPTGVESNELFYLNAEVDGGFWCDDKEICIVQVVAGDGSGESRRVQYDKAKGEFNVLEKPFSALSQQSIIHVWRSTKHQLPTRDPAFERHYVLGVGVNTWKRESMQDNNASTDLIPVRLSMKGNGTRKDFAMTGVPDNVYAEKANFAVFVGGDSIPFDQFSVSKEKGITLISRVPADAEAVEIVYFKEVASKGSSLIFSEATYAGDGNTWSFMTSLVPLTPDYLFVFQDGRLVSSDKYLLAGTSVNFLTYAPNGHISIISAGNLQELGAGTRIIRKESTLRVNFGNIDPIDLEAGGSLERKNAFIFIDGKRLDLEQYKIEDGKLFVEGDYSNATPISILAFEDTIDDVLIDRYSGENTGPEWIDPAGRYVETNRIQSFIISHVGDGSKTVYPMGSQGTAAVVFMGGRFQDPAPITIQPVNGTIILPQPLKRGEKMDIISFQAIKDAGQEVVCSRFGFMTQAEKKTYTIAPPEPGTTRQVSIVSIGGVYQHTDTYIKNLDSITFSEVPPVGKQVEVWHFATKEHKGYSNAMSIGTHVLKSTKTEYIHEYYDAIPIFDAGDSDNTLLFANTVMQYGDEYSVNNENAYTFNIANIDTAVTGQKATSFVFYTGESKTRLMTRDEMRKRYMTRAEIMQIVGGGGWVPDNPGGGDGGGDGEEPGEGSGAKALFLTATSQVFAVTNEGIGNPSNVVFTANAQNITGNVIFTVLAGDADISNSEKTATLMFATMRSDSVTVRARVTDGGVSYFDDVTVVKLYEGKDAVTAILSNESHTIPADVSGIVSSYAGAMTNMEIYRGAIRESTEWSFERSNSVGVSSTITRNQVQITNMTAAQGYVDITATRDGFSPIVKRFSLALSKTGAQGRDGAQGMGATYAVLSNESFVFAASPTGVVTDFSQGKSEIRVIQNLVDETSKWAFSIVPSDGVGATMSGNTVQIKSFSPSNDTGSVRITCTRTGYPSLSKDFTISKAKGSSGSGSSVEGPRGSMTFYVANRTSWSDTVATSAAVYGNGPRLNDTVVQYSNTFSQTRFWNGAAWVILNQVIDGNLLVRGTVGADAISAKAIRADSAIIEDGALGTLKIAGNAVTLTQAVRQPNQNQITISYMGPFDASTSMADPSANPVLSMIVNVTGTQPCLVWAAWSNPGCYEVGSGGDSTYWGKNWKMTTSLSEAVVLFTLTNVRTGQVYKAGQLSTTIAAGYTLSCATNGIFQNIPAGTYTLSLCMCKAYTAGNQLPNFAMRSAGLTFLETKR